MLISSLYSIYPELSSLPIYFGTDEQEVRTHLLHSPACVLKMPSVPLVRNQSQIHLVFDWDSTLANADGDKIIIEHGRATFAQNEYEFRHLPHIAGPFKSVLDAISGNSKWRVSILTSRTGMEAFRVMTTINKYQWSIDALHFTGNQAKGPIAHAIGSDLFFDDIERHVDDVVAHGHIAGWIPYGEAVE